MDAATSIVQVVTLVVATLAVATSGAGIWFTAHATKNTEHAQWRRDLRMQLYSDYVDTITEWNRYLLLRINRMDTEQFTDDILQQLDTLETDSTKAAWRLVTFTEDDTSDAAIDLNSALHEVSSAFWDRDKDKAQRLFTAALDPLDAYGRAVRKALKT
jgi:hypothetical protein